MYDRIENSPFLQNGYREDLQHDKPIQARASVVF
jgi:hypothetical protein